MSNAKKYYINKLNKYNAENTLKSLGITIKGPRKVFDDISNLPTADDQLRGIKAFYKIADKTDPMYLKVLNIASSQYNI